MPHAFSGQITKRRYGAKVLDHLRYLMMIWAARVRGLKLLAVDAFEAQAGQSAESFEVGPCQAKE